MEFEIKITGSGEDDRIVECLEEIAQAIGAGNHRERLAIYGKCVWEDSILLTEIKALDDESKS